jgi:hypothetical protein
MTMAMNRVFLLSPAHSGGLRARLLTRKGASFELARRVQIGDATLGEVFAFCSGLYFRGKLAYARRFAVSVEGVQVITPTRGLLPADHPVDVKLLEEFASVAVLAQEPRFAEPLQKSVQALATASGEVVLLGSIATGKYLDCLLPILGTRLLFPPSFVGRGDMSRGALLLRSVSASEELPYIPVAGAILHKRRSQGSVGKPRSGGARPMVI